MIRGFFKTFMLFNIMFAPMEGFSESIPIDKLYKERLQPAYQTLLPLKEQAKKRQTAYIISGVLALILLFSFAYYFKLLGFIVALVMIIAGFFTLESSKKGEDGYKERFKKEILSPIAENRAGYRYRAGKITTSTIEKSNLFAPAIKEFASWDLYEKEGVVFSYVHIVFDTKENASVERMAKNIFDGYIIMIDRASSHEGVVVSDTLRDEVSGMDLTMHSFFAKGVRSGQRGGFDIYGDVDAGIWDRVSTLHDKKVAISFKKDKRFIALYKKSNPLSVDIFQTFDLQKAKAYDSAIAEIEALVSQLQ
jgi:hypothetical protein